MPRDTPLVAIAGELAPAVRVLADGQEVTRPQIRFQSDSPAVATINSLTGRVTARKRGVAGLRVRLISGASGNQPPESSFAVRVVIARLRLARQPDTLGALNQTVLFRPGYLDARGNPLPAADSSAIKPRFQLMSPGRAVSLDSTGIVVSKANGTDTLQASVDTASVTMIVTVRQRAVRIAFATQPSSASAGIAIAPAVRVAIQDAAGSALAGDTTEITLDSAQSAQGKAGLFGTQKRNAVDGVASFTVSIIKKGRYVLPASAGGFTPVVSDSFDIAPGSPDKLSFIQPPKATRIGQTFPQPVTVAAEDVYGNTVTGAANAVTIGPDSIVTGTLAVPAVNGIATFGDLTATRTGSGYRLVAAALLSPTVSARATSDTFSVLAGSASKLAFTVQPGNTFGGGAITPAVRVAVQDAAGNTVISATDAITLAIGTNPGGGVLSGTSTVNAVNGVATFASLSIGQAGTGYTLTASATGLTGTTSTLFDILGTGATKLGFTVQPSNAPAGASITPAVQVAVQDAGGNTVTTAANAITLTIGTNPGDGTLSGTTTVTAVNGVATFNDLRLSAAGTGYALTATAGGLTVATSTSFNITVPVGSKLGFVVQPSNTQAAGTVTPAVQVAVQDAAGNTVTTATDAITLAIGTNPVSGVLSGTTAVNAINGVATFTDLSISQVGTDYTLTASATGLTGATSTSFNILGTGATKLAFTVQPANSAAGAAITPAVQVAVQDVGGSTVTTATNAITLAIGTNPGGGTLSGTTTVNAVNGVATFNNLRIGAVGTGYTLGALAGGLTGATSTAFNITPAAPTKLGFVVQPTNTQAAGTITPAVQVAVQDAEGNAVTTAINAITIAIGTNAGGGTLSGTTTVAAVNGVATFANLSIDKAGTAYTLTAAGGALTGATSAAFNVALGAASRVGFVAQPTNTTAGAAITPAIQVAVQDAGGNTLATATNAITIAIGTNAGGGTLSGTGTVSAVNGIATFANLSIDKVGSGYTLSASAGGLIGAVSPAFNITVGAASKLVLAVQPSNTQSGATITPAVQVLVQDASGNTVTTASNAVTLGIGTNPAGGLLSGTATASAVNGVATFGDLSINVVGNGYTLTVSATGLTGATSAPFNIISSVVASQLGFLVQASNTQAGAAITPAIQVAVQDGASNTVPSATNAITLAFGANPGSGSLTGTTTANAVNGVATFANLSINKTGTGYTLAATAAGLTGTTSSGFVISVGPTASVVVSPSGASVSAAGATQTFIAQAKDAYGNVNPNASFTWASLNPNVATIDISTGVATAVASGQVTISATVDGKVGYALLTVAIPGATPVNLRAPVTSGTAQDLGRVWGVSDSDIYAVGNIGAIVRYNGTSWTAMTSGTTQALRGVWGTSGSEIYAVGTGATILRYNGTSWSAITSGTTQGLRTVWGTSGSDIFIVGDAGTILRFNGTSWSAMTSGTTLHLNGAWGTSSSDIFVVGEAGTILRYNGTSWSAMTSGTTQHLTGVWGTSGTDVYAVGEGGTILRFNGTSWSAMTSGTTQHLNGLWGTSGSDVYASGAGGTLLRYDGTSWNAMSSGTAQWLHGLWGTSGVAVYAVGLGPIALRGYRGATVTLTPAAPTLTALGATQQMTETAKDAGNTVIGGLTAASYTWTSGNTAVATVSSSGVVTAVANGSATITATAPGGAAGITTVTVAVPCTFVVVTPAGSTVGTPAGTQTFTAECRDASGTLLTGKTFTWSSLNPNVATINSSTGVATAVASGQVTVSATTDGVTAYALLTVAIPGAIAVNLWAPVATGVSTAILGIWGSSPADLFAVGVSGTILRYNGSTWSPMTSPVSQQLNRVWGTSSSDVFAAGAAGTILHFNGLSWSQMTVPTTASLSDIWGSSPSDVFATGDGGTILHYNGSSWSAMTSGTTANLVGLYGTSRSDVWVGGAQGLMLHYDGASWTSVPNGADANNDVNTFWMASAFDGFAVTNPRVSPGGLILRYTAGSWVAMPVTATGGLGWVRGTSASEVYAVGGAKIMRFDGSNWTLVSSGVTGPLHGLWGFSAGDFWTTLLDGRALRGYRGATVTVTPATTTLTALGATQQMTATANAGTTVVPGLTATSYTWTSSNTAVATVSSSGLVTAVANGTATITATAAGGAAGGTTVTVAPFTLASISAGIFHTCGLTGSGAAYCWGKDTIGALGDGLPLADQTRPIPVSGGLVFSSVSAGFFHTCALTTAGSAYCWGDNTYGQLGDGTQAIRTVPTAVSAGLTFSSITTGDYHTCAVTSGGVAYCWGHNFFGPLGVAGGDRSVPTAVSGTVSFASLVASGHHTCGRTAIGTAYCWGDGTYGRLGTGSNTSTTTPTAVAGALNFSSLSETVGAQTCGVTAGGAAYCWGDNRAGQLGTGSTADTISAVPVSVTGALTFTSLAASGQVCGIASGGAAYCWGVGLDGQRGDGTTANAAQPIGVSGELTWSAISAGGGHTCALTTANVPYCWGKNGSGQLGDGSTTNRNVPTRVAAP